MTLIGKTIGNIRVTDLVGEGGMGEVYVGVDQRLKRKVALKAIRGERRFDERIKARLIREAEILSKLEHPNICRIYDLLTTEDADVLVLELIKGKTLNNVQIDDLGRSEKFKIAIQLGVALADAHAHSVVHRDLKPENIMIDDRGDVKVLDFGLAHSCMDEQTVALLRSNAEASMSRAETALVDWQPGAGFETEHGVILGTPMYMSLEQALCKPVTAASDMYSYGLLLQWLFTGASPYPPGLTMPEIFVRATEGNTLPVVGVPEKLKKLIERLKSGDPTRRPTAVDTVAHLKAIEEAPRRRAIRLAGAGAIGILTIGIVVAVFSMYQAKQSERLERIALQRQEKMSSFLVDMWVSPSPMEQGRDVKVIDVLAYGEDKVEREFQDDPLTRNTLLNHLATTYRRLGEYAKAEEIITKCLDDCRRTLGNDHPRTLSAMIELGTLYSYDERFPEAEVLFSEALDSGEGKLAADSDLMIHAKVMYAEIMIRRADYAGAKVLLEEALTVIRGDEALNYKLGPKSLLALGNILDREGDSPAAGAVFQELVASYEQMGDTENPNYIAAMGSLARILMVQGKHAEGLRIMRKGLELSTRINGEKSRNTIAMLINLGQALTDLGEYEEALVYTERGFRIFKEVFGERAPDTAFIAVNYAYLLINLDRFSEAEVLLSEAIELNMELLGPDHPNTINAEYVKSLLLAESGRNAEAEILIRDVIARSTEALGADSFVTLESRDLLAQIRYKEGDGEGSERILREVLETRLETQGTHHASTSNTLFYLAKCLQQQGRFTEACLHAEQALKIRFEVYGGDHPDTREAVVLMVEVFEADGRGDRVDSLLGSLGLR